MSLTKYWEELPPWAKGVTGVAGLAIVYFTGRGIYNGIDKLVQAKKQGMAVDAAKKDITSLSSQGVNPSFPDSQYKLWADKIQAQFDGCDWSVGGTAVGMLTASGQVLYDTLSQFKNDADFLKLQTAWGVRTYAACMSWFVKDKTLTLDGAVSDELSTSEIDKLNNKLKDLGINYSF